MGELKVYFLPVGQGDSTYVELPNGQTMLVDINRHPGHGIDVVRFLKDRIPKTKDVDAKRARKLDYLVITHAHEDHIKGLKELDEEFVFGEIWDSGHEYEYGEDLWKEYKEIIQRYDKKGLVRYRKASSEPFSIGTGEDKVTFHVLSPSSYVKTGKYGTEKEKREAVHEECMVLRMSFRNFRILLTGDSNKASWERILKHYGDVLPSKILHASHHGSRTFFKKGEDDEKPLKDHLTKIDPEYLVVSVSYPSKHEHPHKDAMKLYGEVVSKKNMRYTETKENRQAHVLRIYKSDKDGKWYYVFEADTDLVVDYFLEEKKDLVATKASFYYVNIGAHVGRDPDGPFTERYPSRGRPLEKHLHIRFYKESCNVPEPYEVRWEVTNFGVEAERDNDIYHDSGIQEHGNRDFESRLESTKYKGSHYMDCVILKNGTVICRKRHVVNIQ
jgi:competence protein ComEC